MPARFLVTNGGPHTPETWAVATAEEVFVIAPNMDGDRFMQAKRLQMQIAETLVDFHRSAQQTERDELAANKDFRLALPLEDDIALAKSEADEMIVAIQTALKGSPWEEQYNDPDVVQAAQTVIASHLMTLKDIERQYHK